MFENILYATSEGVAIITINRPDKLNALNKGTILEIGKAVTEAEKDSTIRVIVLTGAGEKSFVAGADISAFSTYSLAEAKELSAEGQAVFQSIEDCTKPVIAAINGFALGGGCELAMSCHMRIAADHAKFGQPEVKLGLIPGYGATQRLTRYIGKTKALELMITTDMIGAKEAFELGLLNYVVPLSELMPKCLEIAGKIKKQAPLAVSGVIKCVNEYETTADGFKTETEVFGYCFTTQDMKEGTSAFLEKRSPVFKGK